MTQLQSWLAAPLLLVATQPAISAPAIPETVTISAAGGYFNDKSRFALPCKNGQLAAVLRLSNLQFAEMWQVTGAIMIFSPNDWARLGTVTKNQKPDRLYALWENSESAKVPISTNPAAYPLQQDVKQGVTLNIAWTEKGTIGGTLNGKTLSPLQLSGPLTEIAFFVVGAEARFEHITTSCDLTS